MGKKRITKIVVESERIVISHRRQAAPVWRAQARTLRPEEAASIAAVTPRTIYRRVEAGILRFTESPDRGLLIRLNSLPNNRTT